jgi:microcystin synthetase protein McyG
MKMHESDPSKPSKIPLALADGGPLNRRLSDADTLSDYLALAAEKSTGITLIDSKGNRRRRSYADLHRRALDQVVGLSEKLTDPGKGVLLHFDDSIDPFVLAWTCLLARVPFTPIVGVADYGASPAAVQRIRAAWEALNEPVVIVSRHADVQFASSPLLAGMSRLVVEDISTHSGSQPVARKPDDRAMILLTSGSTGRPKGVPLRDRHLLSMIHGTVELNSLHEHDVSLNWLPIDHVGAISFLHMLPLVLGIEQVHVMPDYILADVARWVQLLSEYRASISWAPNFAYRLLVDRLRQEPGGAWDLSSVRFLVNAGESVVGRTLVEAEDILSRIGLPMGSIRPAFGMSESCSGITWSFGFDRSEMDQPVVDLGPPIPGAAIRIRDENGDIVPEEVEGAVEIQGHSVFEGYVTKEGIDRSSFTADGWFITGDRGSIHQGRLRVTGRTKDVIIINGIHYPASSIEGVVESIEGIRKTSVAALPVRLPNSETDQLAVFFSLQAGQKMDSILIQSIRTELQSSIRIHPDWMIAVDESEIPRTSIGKIQKEQLRRRFVAGEFPNIASSRTISTKASADVNSSTQIPASDLESGLIRIWSDVLSQSSVPVDVSFFDLGGTSIQLPSLAEKMSRHFGRNISTTDILTFPSIRSWLDQLHTSTRPSRPRNTRSASRDEPIAVIGLACRFPGVDTPDSYWQMLESGKEAILDLTPAELSSVGVPREVWERTSYVKRVAWLEDMECFDAAYFQMTDREALLLDPQHRILMENIVHALEDAGIEPLSFEGKAAVYASAGVSTYADLSGDKPDLQGDFQRNLASTAADYLATRISYKLNLRGPSLTVLAACSSSLLCVHHACQSLRMGDADIAIAGASSVWTLHRAGYEYIPGGLASQRGRCRPFDENADGMIFGNGVASIVLKPLSKALADGDRIRSVIRSSGVNNDGSEKISYWATGVRGQAEAIRDAIHSSGHTFDDIDYIECHGTGTVLGDAIELRAIEQAFADRSPESEPLVIGSVKSNIGHMGVACGLAGLIKVILAMEHGKIPPSLHCDNPNPQLAAADGKIRVATSMESWPAPRVAGVSSFGLGGSNVHLVVEQWSGSPPPVNGAERDRSIHFLPVSAHAPGAFKRFTQQMVELLTHRPGVDLSRLADTLQRRRRSYPVRMALVCSEQTSARRLLEKVLKFSDEEYLQARSPLPISIFFPKQIGLTPLLWKQLCQQRWLSEWLDSSWSRLSESGHAQITLRENSATAAHLPMPILEIVCSIAVAQLLERLGTRITNWVGEGAGLVSASVVRGIISLAEVLETLLQLPAESLPTLDPIEVLELIDRNRKNFGRPGLMDGQRKMTQIWTDHQIIVAENMNLEESLRFIRLQVVKGSDEMILDAKTHSVEALIAPLEKECSIMPALAATWVWGHAVDWSQWYRGEMQPAEPLPGYPFERHRYWPESAPRVPHIERMSNEVEEKSLAARDSIEKGFLVAIAKTTTDDRLVDRIVEFLKLQVSGVLKIPPTEIGTNVGLFDLGLTSIDFVHLSKDLELAMARPLRLSLAIEYPNISALARKLADDLMGDSSGGFSADVRSKQADAVKEESGKSLSDDEIVRLLGG